jgi:hypothetical protein
MGVAEARNIGLKSSRGRYILLLNSNVELTGDILTPLAETLDNSEIGLTGLRGLRTDDLRHFEESEETEVEAIDSTCMAFKRSLLKSAGLLDEGYRYPQFMDIDFSFAIRDNGVRTVRTPELPLICHPEPSQPEDAQAEAQQTRLTKRNFYRYLEKWGDRDDLLLESEDEEEYDDDYEDDDE